MPTTHQPASRRPSWDRSRVSDNEGQQRQHGDHACAVDSAHAQDGNAAPQPALAGAQPARTSQHERQHRPGQHRARQDLAAEDARPRPAASARARRPDRRAPQGRRRCREPGRRTWCPRRRRRAGAPTRPAAGPSPGLRRRPRGGRTVPAGRGSRRPGSGAPRTTPSGSRGAGSGPGTLRGRRSGPAWCPTSCALVAAADTRPGGAARRVCRGRTPDQVPMARPPS